MLQTQVGDNSPADNFSWVGARLGDLDNDDVDDYAVTAITDSDGGPLAGKAFVYSGADGSVINTVTGLQGELLGFSMDTAGDVNGDGTPDYVIGASAFGAFTPNAFGRAIVVSGFDHSVIHEFTPATQTRMGTAVAGVGDGHDDILVGSENAGFSKSLAGQVTLYSGVDGAELWSRDGKHAWDLLGSAADGVGDVDGDGILDVVVGAYGATGAAGELLDCPGAGSPTCFPVSTATSYTPIQPHGDTVNFGQFFTRGAGDYDGDGTRDIFVADYASGRGGRAGRVPTPARTRRRSMQQAVPLSSQVPLASRSIPSKER